MQVYLVRHTSPEIAKGICYGQSDIAINTTLFEAEYEKIQEALPKDIDCIYSSPLQRCKVLSDRLSTVVSLQEDLMELNFGDWEMQKWMDLESDEFNAWMNDFVNLSAKNGESYLDLHSRTLRFLDFLMAQDHKKVVLVCHAGNIRSILSYLLDLPLNQSFRFSLNYGAIVHIELFKDKNFNKLISIQN